ncbi:ArsR family transcriptional regulator (plasmid) [Sulfolobus tengchongensis]
MKYPIYYYSILRELEKGAKTKKELKKKLSLSDSKLYRAYYRLLLDGIITREEKEGNEYLILTDKGKELLRSLREIVMG